MTSEAPQSVPGGLVRRIFGNLGWLLGGKAAAGLISLAYMVIAARVLGPRDYGVLVLVHAYVLTVDGIINFPGWQAVVRYGVLPREQGRWRDLVRLLRFTASIELVVGALAVLVTAGLAPFIGARLGWTPVALALAVPYSLAALANVRSTPGGYLQLVRRFDLLGWHNAVSPLVRLAGAVLAWMMGFGLWGFLVTWLLAALAECLSMWALGFYVARRELPGEKLIGPVGDMRRELPGLGRFMLAANADATFSQIAPQIAPLVVGWVLGPEAAGLYAIAHRATVVISQPAQILGQAAYSEFAKLVSGSGASERLGRALAHSAGIATLAAIPVVLGLAFFSKQLAMLLGGSAFAAAGAVMLWLGPARMIQVVSPIASAALVAIGRPGLSIFTNFAVLMVALPFLPWLLRGWGLPGAGAYAMAQALLGTLAIVLVSRYAVRRQAALASISAIDC